MATAQGAPSADSDKLEHIFELPPSSWKAWIKVLETRIPSLMQETSVPGLSVVLIRDAETRLPVDNCHPLGTADALECA